jgi:nucleoside-diphosphate-sugar epimerase
MGSLVVRALVERGHLVNAFDLPVVRFERIEHLDNVKIFRGDLLEPTEAKKACQGVDVALHLAAILPPYSERDVAKTIAINVAGTANLVRILETESSPPIIFSSSVSIYGQTQDERPPITTKHPCQGTDTYSQSKIAAESVVVEGNIPYTILRITGVYAAELFEFPSPVQFRADQRIEYIDRDDVVSALVSAVEEGPNDLVMNIAGGESWRMRGKEFVKGIFDALGVEGDVNYSSEPGYFDWYDTGESQRLLHYQNTSFETYKAKLAKAFGTC